MKQCASAFEGSVNGITDVPTSGLEANSFELFKVRSGSAHFSSSNFRIRSDRPSYCCRMETAWLRSSSGSGHLSEMNAVGSRGMACGKRQN
jgi:hypothetical protein